MYNTKKEVKSNTRIRPNLNDVRDFNTISLTLNPIKGGTPPRLKNCTASPTKINKGPNLRSLNLDDLTCDNNMTAGTNMIEYPAKNAAQLPTNTLLIMNPPFLTEDKNSI